ncbi:MAG: hypothetical protein AB7O52_07010 [Planctomycetota bacterium]
MGRTPPGPLRRLGETCLSHRRPAAIDAASRLKRRTRGRLVVRTPSPVRTLAWPVDSLYLLT